MMNWSEYEERERKHERSYLRRIMLAVILGGLVVAGVVAFAKRASADETVITATARGENGDFVRITMEPCPDVPEWFGMRKAVMLYHGVDYLSCWVAIGQTILVFDSNGDLTPIPVAAFTKDEAI